VFDGHADMGVVLAIVSTQTPASLRLVVGLSLAAAAFGCDGTSAVRGQVQDSAGRPLAGVSVQLLHSEMQRGATTGLNGSFDVTVFHGREWSSTLSLMASKPGYKDVFVGLYGDGPFDCTLVLETGEAPPGTPMHNLPSSVCKEEG